MLELEKAQWKGGSKRKKNKDFVFSLFQKEEMIVIAQRVFRIGLQKLLFEPKSGQYYVSIQNRTYRSIIPIPKEKVELWKRNLAKT